MEGDRVEAERDCPKGGLHARWNPERRRDEDRAVDQKLE